MPKNQLKRICFVVYDYNSYGGVEVVAVNLANEFSKEYDVFYVGIVGNSNTSPKGLEKTIEKTHLLPKEYRSKRLRYQLLYIYRPLKAFLKSKKIDLIVVLGHYPAFLLAIVRPFLKKGFVFCDHGALINQWGDKKARFMRYIAAKACDKLVVLTEKTRNDYLERFNLNPNKVRVIYNWIEPLECDSKQYNVSVRKIISVGRLSEEKGFDQLIESMRLVMSKHPAWQLDIYGDGDKKEELLNMIKKYHLEKSIHLRGRCDNVREHYKEYAIYVMPSYREGLPMTLLEAKLNMLPIVSFDVDTGPREIVRDKFDGILVEQRNTSALADAICRLIDNQEERIMYSINAKGNLYLFEKDNIVPLWRELFIEAV